MKRAPTTSLAAALLLALAAAACGGDEAPDPAIKAAADKKAREDAAQLLVQPVALIAAYLPYAKPPTDEDKFAFKRSSYLDKAATHAADEIRHAANHVKQKIERSKSDATKDLVDALRAVPAACADASDGDKLAKCTASVAALDVALGKAEAAFAAAGVTAKLPRIVPGSITPEAKAAIAPFLQARGPGGAETAYAEKRKDKAASAADVINACRDAASEVEMVAVQFEKAEEPIRIVAVTHKMGIDSQCNGLSTTETAHKEVVDCKTKMTTPECKLSCAKAKTILDEGLPAAAFAALEKDHADICTK